MPDKPRLGGTAVAGEGSRFFNVFLKAVFCVFVFGLCCFGVVVVEGVASFVQSLLWHQTLDNDIYDEDSSKSPLFFSLCAPHAIHTPPLSNIIGRRTRSE